MIDENARMIVAGVLAGAGVILMLVGALGALRFADIYERAHALRAAAFGAPLVLGALAVAAWDWRIAAKLALLAAALALTGPALVHLIAHAAHRSGVEPEARARARPRP